MLRTTLFTIYGICVGVGYAAAIWTVARNEPIAATFWCIVVILFFATQGWGVGSNREHSNIQGWAWLTFLPLYFIYSAVVMSVLMLVLAPYWWLSDIVVQGKKERQLKSRLAAQGRLANHASLRARLEAGDGTLIRETGIKGAYRVWWTADDLFSLGTPPSRDEEFHEIVLGQMVHAFNNECVRRYLAEDGGNALLTSIPPRYANSGQLARMFPKMRIAMIVNP